MKSTSGIRAAKAHGRILIPDGLRVIRAGLDNDMEKNPDVVFRTGSNIER